MIFDQIENACRYFVLHAKFTMAFGFLMNTDLATLADGRHAIDGDNVFALVFRGRGKGPVAALESHRKYIDIHYLHDGSDLVGVRASKDCRGTVSRYDTEKDIIFFSDNPESWVRLTPGTFVVFYPEDAHAPLSGDEPLVKIVVKVAVECDG